jgi:hypothetical protein
MRNRQTNVLAKTVCQPNKGFNPDFAVGCKTWVKPEVDKDFLTLVQKNLHFLGLEEF